MRVAEASLSVNRRSGAMASQPAPAPSPVPPSSAPRAAHPASLRDGIDFEEECESHAPLSEPAFRALVDKAYSQKSEPELVHFLEHACPRKLSRQQFFEIVGGRTYQESRKWRTTKKLKIERWPDATKEKVASVLADKVIDAKRTRLSDGEFASFKRAFRAFDSRFALGAPSRYWLTTCAPMIGLSLEQLSEIQKIPLDPTGEYGREEKVFNILKTSLDEKPQL